MATIFDIVGENYFSVLASKNRRIYLDSILFLNVLINELFEDGSNDKEIIILKLADYLNDRAFNKLIEENSDDELENTNDSILKAKYIINVLLGYGWLIEESIGNGKKALDFTDNSYSFIELIKEISESKKSSYTSYVKIIKDTLFNFNYNNIDSLEIIDKQLIGFVNSLRGLHSSLQRFYKHITKNKTSEDLVTLLDEFTSDYKDSFFDSSYYRLKVNDNVDTEIPKIESKLEDIFSNEDAITKLVVARRDKNYNTIEKCEQYVLDAKKNILKNIRSIPVLIKMIDSKNSMYITRTLNVIMHLIKRGEDIEGVLNRLISYATKNEIDQSFISLFEVRHYGFNYLAKPRNKTTKTESVMLELDTNIDELVEKKAFECLIEEQKYNILNVNKFVLNFLGEKIEREIKELEINSNYDFIMLISIVMYSNNFEACYKIEFLEERINNNSYKYNNFLLRRKDDFYE